MSRYGEEGGPPWAGWRELLADGAARAWLEGRALPLFVSRQRWFGSKTRRIRSAHIDDYAMLVPEVAVLLLLDVSYDGDGGERYAVPLAVAGSDEMVIDGEQPLGLLATLQDRDGRRHVIDGVLHPAVRWALFALVAGEQRLATTAGSLVGSAGSRFSELAGSSLERLAGRLGGAEQSNTSIRYGDRLVLKLFRRPADGVNPEREVTQLLTERALFDGIAPYAGSIDYSRPGRDETTIAVVQGFVPNGGDAWTWMLDALSSYMQASSGRASAPSAGAGALLASCLDATGLLGKRTAELHLALVQPRDLPAFAPEDMTRGDLEALAGHMRIAATAALDTLERRRRDVPVALSTAVADVLAERARLLAGFDALANLPVPIVRSRVHGDYHLGQVLRTDDDFVIVDFEGEPARSLEERRAKHSPLKDVAGMLRSFSYAAEAGRQAALASSGTVPDRAGGAAAQKWEKASSAEFLRAYRATAGASPIVPTDDETFRVLLEAYVLDKALYELRYELDNRPDWMGIPLRGILEHVCRQGT